MSIDQPAATSHPPTRLTKRFIERLSFNGKPYVVRDTGVRGLLLAVNAHSRSWKVQRDMRTGQPGKPVKTVRHTLGSVDELSIDEARSRAQEVIAAIKRGVDPNAPAQPAAPAAGGWTVEKAYSEYVANLRKKDGSELNITYMLDRLERLLPDWKALPITAIKPSMAREVHARIATENGKRVANHTLKDFRAVFNAARKATDDPDTMPSNPVGAVTFYKEREREVFIMPDDLPTWWSKLQDLPNPLRRLMHELGLFSGLRPGNLVAIERDWIKLDARAIVIPAGSMKGRGEFWLPLSAHMVDVVTKALTLSEMVYPGSKWLFPTHSRDGKRWIATQVWKERDLPSETGHILRHTHRCYANNAGVPDEDAERLLDHAIRGVKKHYLHSRPTFERLLSQQEKISAYILSLLK